ncbi:MAG TPA: hypothetical protein VJU77_05695 [Chthoniobacterales bacterium]|nr:hypothetical protein [Chthoniobacterales bacterium]
MAVSFSNDIQPLFNQFRGQMMWRFDLTNYEQVKANASIINNRLANAATYGPMPPPPFDPLTEDQIQLFGQWILDGCQP